MSNKVYFTPGPSQLYPTVADHIQNALQDDVGSISHRSKAFEKIYAEAVTNLRQLLNLPDDYQVFFVGSATEIWERLIRNCVQSQSFHYVNGSISKRFHQYAVNSGKIAEKEEVDFGRGFDDVSQSRISEEKEIIAETHNETSSGVAMPLDDIYTLRDQYPGQLIAADVVSSIPNPPIDFNKIDSALFSVQKCFGLPAGLGVWLVNQRCIDKAQELNDNHYYIGPHHDIPALLKKAKDNQTPATPNVLNIYLLGKVAGDMLDKGIDTIREETSNKASMLYSYLRESSNFDIFVEESRHRSSTVVVANSQQESSKINQLLDPYDMQVGTGYGGYKAQQIRIANFPAHSVAKTEELIEKLKSEVG